MNDLSLEKAHRRGKARYRLAEYVVHFHNTRPRIIDRRVGRVGRSSSLRSPRGLHHCSLMSIRYIFADLSFGVNCTSFYVHRYAQRARIDANSRVAHRFFIVIYGSAHYVLREINR